MHRFAFSLLRRALRISFFSRPNREIVKNTPRTSLYSRTGSKTTKNALLLLLLLNSFVVVTTTLTRPLACRRIVTVPLASVFEERARGSPILGSFTLTYFFRKFHFSNSSIGVQHAIGAYLQAHFRDQTQFA